MQNYEEWRKEKIFKTLPVKIRVLLFLAYVVGC